MGFFDRISEGLSRSRDKFKEQMNVLLDRGPDLDDEFWDGLEETLILADIGGAAASEIVENLRDQATRRALPDAYAVLDLLNDQIASTFTPGGEDVLGGGPAVVLFVGINGTGKTTTVGKLAKEAVSYTHLDVYRDRSWRRRRPPSPRPRRASRSCRSCLLYTSSWARRYSAWPPRRTWRSPWPWPTRAAATWACSGTAR